MNITFLGQGFEPDLDKSVGNALVEFLADKNFDSFIGISAFSSPSGIGGLAKYISEAKKHLVNITIVTGIDRKGTSKEALEELLNLDINAFVFYQSGGNSKPIFHPKIYLFEGKNQSELIIGSSNLTASGLFSNIEASILISIDNNLDEDKKIITELKHYFKGIFDYTDPNLKSLTKELIEQLDYENFLLTEEERKAAQEKNEIGERKENENMISKIFPKRLSSKVPNEFRGTRLKPIIGIVANKEKIDLESEPLELLWESGPLTERDLNIPKGTNTNPTGSMLFKKGETKGIDQRHYFRDEVFSNLSWTNENNINTPHLERAKASFIIIIGGINHGSFNLTITHNTNTTSRSYQQKNSMTSISWGDAKKIIAREELIGKSAKLLSTSEKDVFVLEIN